MKAKKAKVTISKRGMIAGDGRVHISIVDEASGLAVVEVAMLLSNFADCLTGLSNSEAEYHFVPTQYTVENMCKRKEIKRIYVDKSKLVSRDERKKHIQNEIERSGKLKDGWFVWNDGMNTQQNGVKHEVVLARYVTEETSNDRDDNDWHYA